MPVEPEFLETYTSPENKGLMPDLEEPALATVEQTDKVIGQLKGVLEKGERVTKTLSEHTDLPTDVRNKLSSASKNMGAAAKTLGKGQNVLSKAKLVIELSQALKKWEKADPGSEAFAEAAGEVFSIIGELALSFTGPGNPARQYFLVLANMEDFFVKMRRYLVPQVRRKRQWDEIEKELNRFEPFSQPSPQRSGAPRQFSPCRKPSQPVPENVVKTAVDHIGMRLDTADAAGRDWVSFALDRTDEGLRLKYRPGPRERPVGVERTPMAWEAREEIQALVSMVANAPCVDRYFLIAVRGQLSPTPPFHSGWKFDMILAGRNQIKALIKNRKIEAGYY